MPQATMPSYWIPRNYSDATNQRRNKPEPPSEKPTNQDLARDCEENCSWFFTSTRRPYKTSTRAKKRQQGAVNHQGVRNRRNHRYGRRTDRNGNPNTDTEHQKRTVRSDATYTVMNFEARTRNRALWRRQRLHQTSQRKGK